MEFIGWGAGIFFALFVLLVAYLIFLLWYKKNFKTASNSEALIVTGKAEAFTGDNLSSKTTKVYIGGRRFVHPWKETAYKLDISVRQIPVEVITESMDGIKVRVEAVADVYIDSSSPEVILNAAKAYLGQEGEIDSHTKNRVGGVLRTIVATYEAENLRRSFTEVSEEAHNLSKLKFTELGLKLGSITITKLTDGDGFFETIGRKTIAEAKKEAEIAESNAQLAIEERKNQNAIAQAESDKQKADKESQIRIETAEIRANAEAADEMARAQKQVELAQAQVEAEKARKAVIEAENHNNIILPAEAEMLVARKRAEEEKELSKVRANAERERIIVQAEARKQEEEIALDLRVRKDEADRVSAQTKLETDRALAEAKAESTAKLAEAEATAIRAKGTAEADVKRSLIEAENSIGENIISLRISEQAPKIAEAIAGAYAKVGNITIVGGDSQVNSLNSAVAKGIAGLGNTIESLVGKNPFTRFGDGFGGLRGFGGGFGGSTLGADLKGTGFDDLPEFIDDDVESVKGFGGSPVFAEKQEESEDTEKPVKGFGGAPVFVEEQDEDWDLK